MSIKYFTYRDQSQVGLDVSIDAVDGGGNFVVKNAEPVLEGVDFDIPASQVVLGDIDIGGEVTRGGTGQGLCEHAKSIDHQ